MKDVCIFMIECGKKNSGNHIEWFLNILFLRMGGK